MPTKKKKITKTKKKVTKKVTKKTKVKKKITEEKSSSELVIKTRGEWVKNSLANKKQYQDKYSKSIKNNDDFWRKEGKRITWIKPYKKIKDVKYSKKEVRINWFQDGTLNASANCIDRHIKDKKDKTDKSGRFVAVTVRFKKKLSNTVTLEDIKKNKELSHLSLIRQSRLSVMPIDSKSWKILNNMSKI